ncbi:MAG: cyanophycinase [Elusimicrobiota bacterium]
MAEKERANESHKKQGKLLLIGGNEDKRKEMELLSLLAAEAGGKDARIEIVTTASNEPARTGKAYENAFQKLGVRYAKSLNIRDRKDADSSDSCKRIRAATAIFFSGGDQLRITAIIEATKVADAIRDHYYEEGSIVAGTSAGAAALTTTIIYEGDSPDAIRKGTVKMSGGLGLLDGAVIDTHFVSRGRIARLVQAVTGNPRLIGIGIGEDTGILVSQANKFEVMGSGIVTIIDGSDIGHSSVTEVELDETFSVENLRMHVLSAGTGYDLSQRKFLRSPKPDRR